MKTTEHPRAFGVFKPVGHVVMSFESDQNLRQAAQALGEAGFAFEDIHTYTPQQMISQVDEDIANASPLASIGQDLNLVKAHRELAEKGYSFLVVKASEDDQTKHVAQIARAFHAERAQKYGRFLIEELIDEGSGTGQVFESPDRGLDAETPSGEEKERGKPH